MGGGAWPFLVGGVICLGSRNDEERSEMRYVMRIADLVNHQNFERTLHNFVVCLLECLIKKKKKI